MTPAIGTTTRSAGIVLVLAVASGVFGGDGTRPDPSTAPAAITAAATATPAILPPLPPPPLPRRVPQFVEINARPQDRPLAERAIAILRRHDQLATSRHGQLWRPGPRLFKRLSLNLCDVCSGADDELGTVELVTNGGSFNSCVVLLNMRSIRRSARSWGVPTTLLVAAVVVHEQEHCLRAPDYRERPAVDAEVRFARKLRNALLIDFATSRYDCLDRRGYWKQDC